MRKEVIWAVVTVLFAAGVSIAAPSEPVSPIEKKLTPKWLEEPSFDDLAKAYPEEALKKQASGRTEIECTVESDGQMSHCALKTEAPVGLGFGKASLTLADRFRMKPEDAKAYQAGTGRVVIPIRWALVTHPQWLTISASTDLDKYFPPLASAQGVGGQATARCIVKADGTLTGCVIVSENPPGLGFGAATLKATARFRMRPMTIDGEPVEGAMVQIPMNWIGSAPQSLIPNGVAGFIFAPLTKGAPLPPGARKVGCPTEGEKSRQCAAYQVRWVKTADPQTLWGILNANHPSGHESQMSCTVSATKSLVDCAPSASLSANTAAAMLQLATYLTPPSEWDGLQLVGARLVIFADWEQLWREASVARKRSEAPH